MTLAIAGWIVLGAFCAAALVLMLLGALHVARAQREFKIGLKRLEETQRRTLDPERLNAALTRISRDAESAAQLIARAQRAVATIGVAVRYVSVAARVVKLLT
jgi:hypothetical protein